MYTNNWVIHFVVQENKGKKCHFPFHFIQSKSSFHLRDWFDAVGSLIQTKKKKEKQALFFSEHTNFGLFCVPSATSFDKIQIITQSDNQRSLFGLVCIGWRRRPVLLTVDWRGRYSNIACVSSTRTPFGIKVGTHEPQRKKERLWTSIFRAPSLFVTINVTEKDRSI